MHCLLLSPRRFLTSAAILVSFAAPAMAAELETSSRIDNVTVYPDGATVTRLINIDLAAGDHTVLARDFPLSLDPSSLRVEGEGARLTIGAIDAAVPRAAPPANLPEIDQRIEKLRDRRAELDGSIAAAQARRQFAQNFAQNSPAALGEKDRARPLAEWREAFAAVAEEVAAAEGAVRDARIKQRDIDRELARLESERRANPPRKIDLRIGVVAGQAAPATLRVTYTVRNARWVPLYDARLDTDGKGGKPSLELIRRAEVVQSTGEDWTDVALAVSTARIAKGGNAPELRPLLAHFPAPPPPAAAAYEKRDMLAARAPDSAGPEAMPAPAREQEAAFEAGGFQAVFRVPGRVSMMAQQGARSFRLATTTIAPELIVRAVPALDVTAFLEAGFRNAEETPLMPGRVALYRDGLYVGRSSVALTPKDEEVRLGFGADDQVKIARTVARKLEGSAGIIGSSKTDEREFKITVRNGHSFPVKVSIEDQIPVSEAADIVVEMLSSTTPPTARDVRDRRGVLEWAFEAAPGEARDIKLGWRVKWPKDKAVVLSPA
ncbi:mucoidy inhibitor MuiA family protein [Undibacter mobilis]|uniref:Mucoidy inhibitor MuiA family protein n=1 Tax=Undibacter mobilis TaxID=2292256 RepID=A0A371B6S4_9BRAD|nr:mucoidy inhibitor MuiA family protein [Undibacter mobilis]RDV03289.1 mucoidy inhibitor MuiA family protein [Undibacter mobilis]